MKFRNLLLTTYRKLSSSYGARAIILTSDLFLGLIAYYMAIQLRHNFETPEGFSAKTFLASFVLIAFVRIIAAKVFRTYSGIIRFTGEKDLIRLFWGLATSTGLLLIISSFLKVDTRNLIYIPQSILLIEWLLAIFFQVGYRITTRLVYKHLSRDVPKRTNIAILGAGSYGNITKRTLEADQSNLMKVAAFFDDHPDLHHKSLDGIKIYDPAKSFGEVVKKLKIEKVIIAIEWISFDRKKAFVDLCLDHQINVMIVPPVKKWLNNEFQTNLIRNVSIEELLDRNPIELQKDNIAEEIRNRVILVTGAAGSIGSEIAKQVMSYHPKKLILLDQAESPLWELFLELKEGTGNGDCKNLHIELADVRTFSGLERIFAEHRPETVFHAAAYKHVPILESFPQEAIKVNVLGVKNMADLAVKYDAKKFILISTDKAVNPSNVMGASKRVSEIYVQSLNEQCSTKFITTRFGNVLGSNGSVVPRFKKQIRDGGPITVTHKDITRYFMTIPEACQLVLEAGTMGKGGEIFLFDMGEPVKIVDLARKMIKLSGLKEGEDIDIVFTGLREGEKLYEELLSNAEGNIPTHHDKIMIGKANQHDYEIINSSILRLAQLLEGNDHGQMVSLVKEIVPEFISNASRYEALDKGKGKKKLNGTHKRKENTPMI